MSIIKTAGSQFPRPPFSAFQSHSMALSAASRRKQIPATIGREYASATDPEGLRFREPKGDRRGFYRPSYYPAFIECVRERGPPVVPIEDAVRSDALSHISLLAIKSAKEVVWDPAAYRIVSPDALNTAMSHEIRGPWQQS